MATSDLNGKNVSDGVVSIKEITSEEKMSCHVHEDSVEGEQGVAWRMMKKLGYIVGKS